MCTLDSLRTPWMIRPLIAASEGVSYQLCK
jgi:hypothetical protein